MAQVPGAQVGTKMNCPFLSEPDSHDSKPQSAVSGEGSEIISKVGRNETCPCGSGKKYKKCCGNNQSPGCEIHQPVQSGQDQKIPDKQDVELSAEKPGLEDLRELYLQAFLIRDGRFWEWMDEGDIFGVQNPETGEIAYCSFMGAFGEVLL